MESYRGIFLNFTPAYILEPHALISRRGNRCCPPQLKLFHVNLIYIITISNDEQMGFFGCYIQTDTDCSQIVLIMFALLSGYNLDTSAQKLIRLVSANRLPAKSIISDQQNNNKKSIKA